MKQPTKKGDLLGSDSCQRICILTNDPHEGFHGSYRQAFSKAQALAGNGCYVYLLTTRPSPTRLFFVQKEIRDQLEIHQISSVFLKKKIGAIMLVGFYLFWLRRKYDFLQTNTDHFCYCAALISKILKKKFIVVSTSYYGERIQPGKFASLKAWTIGKSTCVVALTEQIRNFYSRLLPSRCQTVKIPNGIDTEKFCPVTSAEKREIRRGLGLNEEHTIVLFVGNILKEKGIDLLLEQMRKNKKFNQGIRLWIIGNQNFDPDFSQAVRQFIGKHGLSDHIYFWEAQSDIASCYQSADIFILPSRREGLPSVVLEAMACALPSIVSNLGYTKELIQSDNGFVFALEEPDTIWTKINEWAQDQAVRERIGKQARGFIEQHYSLEIAREQYLQLYHSLVDH